MLQRLSCEEKGQLFVVIKVSAKAGDSSDPCREEMLLRPLFQQPLPYLQVEKEFRPEDDDETTFCSRSVLDDG